MRVSRAIERLCRFKANSDGTALVEFTLILPVFLLAFFVVVEFARLFFSYQAAVQGVRDATRYMARITDESACAAGAGSAIFETREFTDGTDRSSPYFIIERNMDNEVGGLPAGVELNIVRSRVFCIAGAPGTYRTDQVPMAEIEADFTIRFPLVGILELNGRPLIEAISHTINDKSRIYGT